MSIHGESSGLASVGFHCLASAKGTQDKLYLSGFWCIVLGVVLCNVGKQIYSSSCNVENLLQIEIWMQKEKNEKANLIREAEKRDYQMLKGEYSIDLFYFWLRECFVHAY